VISKAVLLTQASTGLTKVYNQFYEVFEPKLEDSADGRYIAMASVEVSAPTDLGYCYRKHDALSIFVGYQETHKTRMAEHQKYTELMGLPSPPCKYPFPQQLSSLSTGLL